MDENGQIWPEQEAVDKWARNNSVLLSKSLLDALKKDVTAYRLTRDKEIACLKDEMFLLTPEESSGKSLEAIVVMFKTLLEVKPHAREIQLIEKPLHQALAGNTSLLDLPHKVAEDIAVARIMAVAYGYAIACTELEEGRDPRAIDMTKMFEKAEEVLFG